MKQTGKPVVAAFDSSTLTRLDTLLPFLLHNLGHAMVACPVLVRPLTLMGYALGPADDGVAKEQAFMRCLAGDALGCIAARALFAI